MDSTTATAQVAVGGGVSGDAGWTLAELMNGRRPPTKDRSDQGHPNRHGGAFHAVVDTDARGGGSPFSTTCRARKVVRDSRPTSGAGYQAFDWVIPLRNMRSRLSLRPYRCEHRFPARRPASAHPFRGAVLALVLIVSR